MSHFSGSDVPECYKCYDNFEKILMCQVQKKFKRKVFEFGDLRLD